MSNKKLVKKSLAAAVISLGGIGVIGSMQANSAHAAVVNKVYRVYRSTTVYNSYKQPVATGQVLKANSSWKIIRTARDAKGNTWYDLGKNQWVKVVSPASSRRVATHRYGHQHYQVVKRTYHHPYYHHYARKNYRPQVRKYYRPQAKRLQVRNYYRPQVKHYGMKTYAAKISGSEASAKNWIAQRESGGSYRARNGQYIGRYQLSASYLHGDYSVANQERTANWYVHNRYGSWARAKSFWQIHGWY